MTYSPLELANAFIQTGELSDALAALDDHLTQAPQDEQALRLRAAVRLRLGDETNLRAAIDDLQRLASPSVEDYQQISIIFERLQEIPAAIDALHQALALSPQDARLAERLVMLYCQQQDWQSARDVVAQMPHSWRWQQWAGDLAVNAGDFPAAAEHYEQALALLEQQQLAPDYHAAMAARLWLALGHAYRQLADFFAAASAYDEAERCMPDEPLLPFYRGLLAWLQQDAPQAIALCRHALDRANETLREEMRTTLQANPTFMNLFEQVFYNLK